MAITPRIRLKRNFPGLESLAQTPESKWSHFLSRTAEINPFLSSQEYGVLYAAISPTCQNYACRNVMMQLAMKERDVKYALEKVYRKLEVHDAFSAVYTTLENGLLDIGKIPGLRVEDIASKLSELIPSEEKILDTMAELAMRYGEINYKSVAAILPLRVKTIKHYIGTIKSKLGFDNQAQLAVAAYIRKHHTLPESVPTL